MNKILCTYIRRPSGERVLCQVTEMLILDYRFSLPLMEVRALEGEPLNPINRIVVPMQNVFMNAVQK